MSVLVRCNHCPRTHNMAHPDNAGRVRCAACARPLPIVLDPAVAKAAAATWPNEATGSPLPALNAVPTLESLQAANEALWREANDLRDRLADARHCVAVQEKTIDDLRNQLAGELATNQTPNDLMAERDSWRERCLESETDLAWHKRELARGKR